MYGPSGSGKSTFMKMLTERIRLEKSTDIPSTSRFLFYDEKLKFGSLSIFEELFCCSENPDLTKMQEILQNLHLWCEIKSNCFDVWKWMKEKQFENSLSNGQRILEYIVRYANLDKKRIVIISTHQNIDGFKNKLASEYIFRNLQFSKAGEYNIVKEI